MDPHFEKLKAIEETARWKLAEAEQNLRQARQECRHTWDDPQGEYTPDVQEAYRTEGDLPGTMGVDFRGPCHVPRQETPKWTRTCTVCGHQEVTTRTTEQVIKKPRF